MLNILIFIIGLFIFKNKTSAISFNQPKFCPTASWNTNGITLANQSIVGDRPLSVFVNSNNTIYIANLQNRTILVWHNDSIYPTEIIDGNFRYPYSLFVTLNGDIFIDDGQENGRVQKWEAEKKTFVTVMNVNSRCYGLFVDTNDSLYCSMHFDNKVVKRSLNDPNMTSISVAAGNGSEGSALNQFNVPRGIFVDVNFDLYVADWGNDRVQLFPSGESNGITVAGSKSPNPTINLKNPTGIILDAEKYLFIVDSTNHRIVGSSLNGFRCLVGCYGGGSQSNQLDRPVSLSFDSSGNMLVADWFNNRIQKFGYLENSCAVSINLPKFCPTAYWNPNGITFPNQSIVGDRPLSVFVNSNNTIYVAKQYPNTISVWHNNSIYPTEIIDGDFTNPYSLFVTLNGDIFIDDGQENGRVQKWEAEKKTFVTVMNVNARCYGLFVDTNDSLYCSMDIRDQVVKRSLNDPNMTSMSVAAGNGSPGSALNQLNGPRGIFVDVNFDLYVADVFNDRVQLFPSGESNGTIVAGSESSKPTINLKNPTGIILDAEKYLFIVDSTNHRIVGSSLNGFRCLVGCYGRGSQSNQLYDPFSLSFDRSGNMLVADLLNNRIQKFEYLKKSCVYFLLDPQNAYVSSLSIHNQIYSRKCDNQYVYYESIEIKVNTSGDYTFLSYGSMNVYGLIYRNRFNPLNPLESLLDKDDNSGFDFQFRLDIYLDGGMTYILVMTTSLVKETGPFSIVVLGDDKVILNGLSTPVNIQLKYSLELTVDSPTYYRDCEVPQCHYETLEMYVDTNGEYVIWSESNIDKTYGYIYKNDFNSLKPSENLLLKHNGSCNEGQFKLMIQLEMNTRYVLVVTTHHPNTIGNFTISISGPKNVTLRRLNPEHHRCVIGDRCNFYIKGIGLTLDDILRDELRPNMTMSDQSISIKLSATLTMIMFVGGLINSILSLITFQNKECRQVGCGMYLLASSVTSFLSISMLTIKFWFVVLSQINVSTSLSVLQGGCASLEVILKLFLYLDGWLNACVAVERAILVFKGVNFDKKKSRHFARRIIFVLPFCIIMTLIHELLYRRLFVYEAETNKIEVTKRYVSCVTHYSRSVQDYNTTILLLHLVAPFIANLCSALLIIFGAARQRSVAQTDQSFKEHIREQVKEHKQLIISPIILLVLSIPRLIISLLPGCVKKSENFWLYLSAYFISFIPSMLIFVIFVVPSEFYLKTFKQTFKSPRQRNQNRQ